jgi:hypothetical protein
MSDRPKRPDAIEINDIYPAGDAGNGDRDTLVGIGERRDEMRGQVRHLWRQRLTVARVVASDIPTDSLDALLENADIFGFSNFEDADPPADHLDAFNRFLYNNKLLIDLGLNAYANLPKKWLGKRGSLRIHDVFGGSPSKFAQTMLDSITRDNHRLMLKGPDSRRTNYFVWSEVFKVLRLVSQYKKENSNQ